MFTIFPSWLLPTLLALSISFIILYTLISKRASRNVPKLPPSPPRLPIIGNLHQLLGKLRHQTLLKLSQEYGPIMLLYIGVKPFIVISTSALATQVLKTQDQMFCSRPPSQATKRLSYNYLDIAFSPYSTHWKEMRKLLVSEFLGPKRARLFHQALVMEIDSMVRSVSLNPSNTTVNLNKMLLAVVQGVVCRVAFGKNYEKQLLNGASWEETLNDALTLLGGSIGDNFPWIGRILDQLSGWNDKLEKCFSNLDAYIQMTVDEHLNHTTVEVRDDDKDFVHALVELSLKENTSDYRLTKEDIKALVMDVLTGGIDTTVITIVWAMSELARNHRVMQKLKHEIRHCTGRKQKVDELDITKMPYLKMVVKETLRLHPPAPLLIPHECLSHCQIGGYDVFPGMSALINGWAIGRDPSTWGDNAAEFYPERFENLEVDFAKGKCEMVPFGGGRRTCPAINTAPATVEFTIASILYWFDWELPGGLKNEDLNMEEEGWLVVRKKSPLCLVPMKPNWKD